MKLYVKNNCSACKNVEAYLQEKNYAFEEVNIEEDPEAAMSLVTMGIRSVPVLMYLGSTIIGSEQIKAQV